MLEIRFPSIRRAEQGKEAKKKKAGGDSDVDGDGGGDTVSIKMKLSAISSTKYLDILLAELIDNAQLCS